MKYWKNFSRLTLLFALLMVLLASVSAPVNAAPRNLVSAGDVVISEVAWGGTAANSVDEWIELYNTTNATINLSGWTLATVDLSPNIVLTGVIPANGYYLIECTDDYTVLNIKADFIIPVTCSTNLSNSGEVLNLKDSSSYIIDTANSGCVGCWYAGSGSPDFYSMERIVPIMPDGASAWKSNDGVTHNGLDANNNPINGTPHNSQIDLALSMKMKDISSGNATFTITVINMGYGTATNVSVKDDLTGLNFVSSSGSVGSYGSGVWTIGSLSTGSNASLDITVNMPSPNIITNTAEIFTSDQLDPDSTPNNSNVTEDDYDSIKIGLPILDITNTVNNSNPVVGSNVIFTITVNNLTNTNASNVNVDAKLPDGLTYISYSSSAGTSYNSSSGLWTIGVLNTNNNAILNITARVITTNPPLFSVVVSADNFGDNVAVQSINNPLSGESDLSLSQSTYLPSTTTAGNVVLTINITNTGPDNATDVSVKDLLPSGLTYVSSTAPSGTTYSSSAGIWSIGNLAYNATATLKITVKVSSSGTSTNNFAEVWNSDQYDPDSTPANGNRGEDDEDGMEVPVSDLSLSETVDLTATTAIFTIRLINSGPDNATNVNVKTSLPSLTSAYTFSSSGSTQGIYNKDTGIWTVGSLADGANASLTITTNIVGPLLVNWVEVFASDLYPSDQPDPDSVPGNNSHTEDDDASSPSSDLSITQSVTPVNPDVGGNVVFTIRVSNAGAGGTTNVQVKDLLPAGLTYVSNDLGTAYTSSTGIWVVGALAASGVNSSKVLNITAKVTTNGIKTNWAEVWRSDASDPDSTPGNGSTIEDDDASATITSYRSVIINEIAWAGTVASPDDQWIELYNPSNASIDITGWILKSTLPSSTFSITLSGTIRPGEYFLLERDDNNTVKDVTADLIYFGPLSVNGETLQLNDNSGNFIDTANQQGFGSTSNPWPKGSISPNHGSMERKGTTAENDAAWETNIGNPKYGLAANGGLIYGTPRRVNSTGSTIPVFITPIPTPSYHLVGRPIINEFLARPGFDWNQDGRVDVFDEFIEIKNIGLVDININGWKLDDEANLGSEPYTIPSMTLKPGERKVFYGLTTNILLGDGGDTVRLLNPSGIIFDSYTYPVVKVEDQSTCRLPDAGGFIFGAWVTDCNPTPNLANTREGTLPSMPGGEVFQPPTCDLPDTLPADFLFAECYGYGTNIWNAFYWDRLGWQGERFIPANDSKQDTFVK